MIPSTQFGKQANLDSSANLTSPTPTMDETTLNDLPILTEVVTETTSHLPHTLNAEEIQQLLPQLEARLETLFTQKLRLHLEQMQRLAIDQALDELKAELPELLRNALDAHLDSR